MTDRQRQINQYIQYVRYLLERWPLEEFIGLPCALHFHTWNNRIGNLVFTRWINYTNISPRISDTLQRVPSIFVDGRQEQSESGTPETSHIEIGAELIQAFSVLHISSINNEVADIVSRSGNDLPSLYWEAFNEAQEGFVQRRV